MREAIAIGAIVLTLAIGYRPALARDEPPSESSPIKLVGAVQGPCKKGELSRDEGCVVPPHLKKRVQPRFPKSARPGKDVGTVTIGATVETDGSVGPVKVIDSSNPGHGFEESALAAVQKWRYKPAELGGVPIRIYFTVMIEFTYR